MKCMKKIRAMAKAIFLVAVPLCILMATPAMENQMEVKAADSKFTIDASNPNWVLETDIKVTVTSNGGLDTENIEWTLLPANYGTLSHPTESKAIVLITPLLTGDVDATATLTANINGVNSNTITFKTGGG